MINATAASNHYCACERFTPVREGETAVLHDEHAVTGCARLYADGVFVEVGWAGAVRITSYREDGHE